MYRSLKNYFQQIKKKKVELIAKFLFFDTEIMSIIYLGDKEFNWNQAQMKGWYKYLI